MCDLRDPERVYPLCDRTGEGDRVPAGGVGLYPGDPGYHQRKLHHKNKIRNDNRIQNLQVMTLKEHASFHMKERHKKKKRKKKGMMTY